LPANLKKKMIKAVVGRNSDFIVKSETDGLNYIMVNIGRSDQPLFEDELVMFPREARSNPTTNLLELV
jgi:hypothetical protein